MWVQAQEMRAHAQGLESLELSKQYDQRREFRRQLDIANLVAFPKRPSATPDEDRHRALPVLVVGVRYASVLGHEVALEEVHV